MLRVRFFHWKAAEAASTEELLRAAGFQVDYDCEFEPAILRRCRESPPAVFLIDLSRLPSQGREIAIALRRSPRTRHVPIVFCDGLPEKVKLIQAVLPDAAYCTGKTLLKTLKNVRAVESPVQPADMMNRYASRTTAQKLGIAAGSKVALVNPPPNAGSILGDLPPDAELVEEDGAVTLCFIHSVDDVAADVSRLRGLASQTRLWFLWCKKGSANHGGITENLVRNTGLDLGLVDYKICSVNPTWSAMAFAQRKAAP